jgi:putative ABC transport system substrate-binding protein
MKRRQVLALFTAAAMWPFATRAQQPAMPVIGFLSSASPGAYEHLLTAFRQGLSEAGFDEGRNVAIEYRWAEDRNERLPELAKELVRRQVAVLVAVGGAALAAKAATATIPIVFNAGGDPVALGLVASLNRPSGNLTGVTGFATLLEAKRMGLLRELVPSARAIAVLVNPTNANVQAQLRDTEDSARRAGVRLIPLSAKVESDFETAFVTLVQQHADALLIGSDPFFTGRRDRLVALSARHKLPTIYEFREFAAAGGLMSYGTNRADGNRQIGVYTGRILKGAKPGDLPVLQPTKFELVINLKTAKALGITTPQGLLLRADEVIQ